MIGYSADMYSFAIMLWEMLKLEKPYAKYSKKMHTDLDVSRGERPKLEESWSQILQEFLNSCWNQDLERRPTAEKASAILMRCFEWSHPVSKPQRLLKRISSSWGAYWWIWYGLMVIEASGWTIFALELSVWIICVRILCLLWNNLLFAHNFFVCSSKELWNQRHSHRPASILVADCV